ncbi:MAG: transglutaminase domain-containing protein, partial [Moraxellaceae bacterium]
PKADVRAPLDSPSELQAALGLNPYAHYAKLAQAGDADPGLIAQAAANAANQELQAALGESVEVQLTPEIKALAQSLNNSSTEIYAWVHNTIKFIPSYGSIQGAQATLETKQGNALDTASLLIALLRAAKIPARYAYGTVEIPAEQVMNWVGGAHTPEAAQQLLGQGGIPNVGLLEGGKIAKFKLEHVWVEAFVDFMPSRGMVEKAGDSWVPMDGSFKQYEFSDGMNLKDEVPFNAQALADTLKQKSTINETEGWVQNVPQADIEQQLTQFQTQLKNYIEQQNPTATVGEVLGLQKIKIIPTRPLAAGLPYQRIITSQKFIEVPDKLRHKFKYSLATESYGYAGDAFISIEEPTAKLAGKTLALSFKPATKVDEDIIAATLPAPSDDGTIKPAQLPKTLSGYLINLAAEFSINGEVLKTNPAGKMGSELYEEMGLYSPSQGWETSINHPVAGEYRAIGLDLQGANIEQAARLKQRLEQTKSRLESAEAAQLSVLTKQDLVGDLLYGTVFNYFALNDLQDQVAAKSSQVISYRLPSYGTFSTTLNPQYWFGMPRNVEFGGLSMDIDHMKQHRIAKNNNQQETVAFSQSIGARMSAMEHLVPEQMFSTETEKAQGISAVKALAIATQQGQKIWTITPDNLELALSKINLGEEAETDLRNAVNSGKIATAHENRINFNGWIGEGYT